MLVSRFATAALLTLVTVLSVSVASAADYAPPVIVQPPPQQCCSNWYLRGDIGMSSQKVGSLYNDNYSGYDSVVNEFKGFDSAPFFGLGIGYIVNNWLRFDVTGEYRGSANFHGYDLGMAGGVPYPDLYNGSKSEWTFLANAYVDLGTWWNLTPFVGAGVGTSRNTISNFTDTSGCVGGCGNPGANWYSNAASHWSFAWALYAGFGYQITKNVTIELAYRYIDLGKATTGTMISYDGLTDTPFEFDHLTSQDVKLGVRFNLDCFTEPPPVYQQAPPLRSRG